MWAAILDDVTDPSSFITHSITYLVDHMTGYLLEVKYLRNIVTPQKPREGAATTPPPPLYQWGY